jgi:hypothetical protein
VRTPPEPLLTLEEACERYFPGKSACALRWMIKRRGYAHSRWGREYRLTYSQVAAIQADMAMPASPQAPDGRPARILSSSRSSRARQQPAIAGNADVDSTRERRKTVPPQTAKRALAEQLSAPLSAAVPQILR